jgi:Fanconi anemia group M protein
MNEQVKIAVDDREEHTGLIALLHEADALVHIIHLEAGDYFVNDQLLVERKTASDFVQSLISGRLFNQCRKLRESNNACMIVVEGSPYKTNHDISHEAVRGALLAVMVAWQIPVCFSENKQDTARILVQAGTQQLQSRSAPHRKGFKPKKAHGRKLYFLQGLPQVGSQLAKRLLEHFGSIENILKASVDDLMLVEGIGKLKAENIVEFIRKNN